MFKAWKVNFDYKSHGRFILDEMGKEARIHALSKHLDLACGTVGAWETLSEDQKAVVKHNAWLALALAVGKEAFQSLNKDEKQDAHLLFWHGCAMHKEMNAVKGGAASMAAAWNKHKLTPPIPLRNKSDAANPAVSKRISTDQHTQKPDTSQGAVKFTSLVGAVVNNKKDKIGQQDTFKYFFEV